MLLLLFRHRSKRIQWLIYCCLAIVFVFIILIGSNSISVLTPSTVRHNVRSRVLFQSKLSGYSRKTVSRTVNLGLEVVSAKERVIVSINGIAIVDDAEPVSGRGLHVVVLEGNRGACTAYRIFDTYASGAEVDALEFLRSLPDGRVVIFSVKDEASHSMSKALRDFLETWSSSSIGGLGWRDLWAFVVIKNGPATTALGESFSKAPSFVDWAAPSKLRVQLSTFSFPSKECHYHKSDGKSSERRRSFCLATDGYRDLCKCDNPDEIDFKPLPLRNLPFVTSGRIQIPVIVIASNRPFYLNTMLRTLLNTSGVNKDLVTVFVDGSFDEPMRIASLYGVKSVQHIPGGHANARISQHYKSSIAATFAFHSDVDFAIVLEEDLKVSPDFFSFIAQTLSLLEKDESLYCISAWNDLGYENTVGNAEELYRVETMPGLGWVVSRKLFTELEKAWPSENKRWDWDMWMRSPAVRKGRECIIPDISRTAHFGAQGLNINRAFQSLYFEKHAFYEGPEVELNHVSHLVNDNYDRLLKAFLISAIPVNHSLSPCQHNFFPNASNTVSSVFIRMDNSSDFSTWLILCKCLKIWDLDQRGVHKGLWRFYARKHHPVLVVGVPASAFAEYLPDGIVPIDLISPVKKAADVPGNGSNS